LKTSWTVLINNKVVGEVIINGCATTTDAFKAARRTGLILKGNKKGNMKVNLKEIPYG